MDEPLGDGFHAYAVDWEPGRIRWGADGVQCHEATPADVAPHAWVFEHPFFLLLYLAVGGHFGRAVSTTARFPASVVVDHVRVHQAAPPG